MSETEDAEEFAEPARQEEPARTIDPSLKKPFQIDGIKVIESTPGH